MPNGFIFKSNWKSILLNRGFASALAKYMKGKRIKDPASATVIKYVEAFQGVLPHWNPRTSVLGEEDDWLLVNYTDMANEFAEDFALVAFASGKAAANYGIDDYSQAHMSLIFEYALNYGKHFKP